MSTSLHWKIRNYRKYFRQDGRWDVLTQLMLYANTRNRAWPAQRTLAEDLDYNKATINRAIKWLIEHGAINLVPPELRTGNELSIPPNQYVYELTGGIWFDDMDKVIPYLYVPKTPNDDETEPDEDDLVRMTRTSSTHDANKVVRNMRTEGSTIEGDSIEDTTCDGQAAASEEDTFLDTASQLEQWKARHLEQELWLATHGSELSSEHQKSVQDHIRNIESEIKRLESIPSDTDQSTNDLEGKELPPDQQFAIFEPKTPHHERIALVARHLFPKVRYRADGKWRADTHGGTSKDNWGRLGMIAKALYETFPKLDFNDLAQFYSWYGSKYPQRHKPTGRQTVLDGVGEWMQTRGPQYRKQQSTQPPQQKPKGRPQTWGSEIPLDELDDWLAERDRLEQEEDQD